MSLNKITIQRLASDVKFLLNNSIENIYYMHSEESILKGYALIIGNNDTPYSNGYFLFKFNFPENYPFSPPKLKYLTNDGKMRFNPNLYSDGKVCLSLLNTWKGEGWTSTQTIYSILITLSSILNNKPLLNEPGINENNKNIEPYNLLINYKTIEISIINQINFILNNKNTETGETSETRKTKKSIESRETRETRESSKNKYINILLKFKNIIIENFKNNKNNINNNINNLEKQLISYNNTNNSNNSNIFINTYNLNYNLDINSLRINLNKIKIE